MNWPVYEQPETDLNDLGDLIRSRLNLFFSFCLERRYKRYQYDDLFCCRLTEPEGWLTLRWGLGWDESLSRPMELFVSVIEREFWLAGTLQNWTSWYEVHDFHVDLCGKLDMDEIIESVKAELGELARQDEWLRGMGFESGPDLFVEYSLPLQLRGRSCFLSVTRIGAGLYGQPTNGVNAKINYRTKYRLHDFNPAVDTVLTSVYLAENEKGDAVKAILDSFTIDYKKLKNPFEGDLTNLTKAELLAALPPKLRWTLIETRQDPSVA